MENKDWFRRKTWTQSDKEDFLIKLRRSRGAFNKAQYARIQAYELLMTHKREAYVAALELLDMILVEWADEAQLASVYHHRGECLVGLGDLVGAVDSYRKVFDTQRIKKGERTSAHLDFGWIVVMTPLPEFYDEVLALLREFDHGSFPIEQYRASVIHAFIFDANNQRDEAKLFAKNALDVAGLRHSGFYHHPTLGLVESQDKDIYQKLQRLADSS